MITFITEGPRNNKSLESGLTGYPQLAHYFVPQFHNILMEFCWHGMQHILCNVLRFLECKVQRFKTIGKLNSAKFTISVWPVIMHVTHTIEAIVVSINDEMWSSFKVQNVQSDKVHIVSVLASKHTDRQHSIRILWHTDLWAGGKGKKVNKPRLWRPQSANCSQHHAQLTGQNLATIPPLSLDLAHVPRNAKALVLAKYKMLPICVLA